MNLAELFGLLEAQEPLEDRGEKCPVCGAPQTHGRWVCEEHLLEAPAAAAALAGLAELEADEARQRAGGPVDLRGPWAREVLAKASWRGRVDDPAEIDVLLAAGVEIQRWKGARGRPGGLDVNQEQAWEALLEVVERLQAERKDQRVAKKSEWKWVEPEQAEEVIRRLGQTTVAKLEEVSTYRVSCWANGTVAPPKGAQLRLAELAKGAGAAEVYEIEADPAPPRCGSRGKQGKRLGGWVLVDRDDVFAWADRHGVTAGSIGEWLEVGPSVVYAWKAGRRFPSEVAQRKLAVLIQGDPPSGGSTVEDPADREPERKTKRGPRAAKGKPAKKKAKPEAPTPSEVCGPFNPDRAAPVKKKRTRKKAAHRDTKPGKLTDLPVTPIWEDGTTDEHLVAPPPSVTFRVGGREQRARWEPAEEPSQPPTAEPSPSGDPSAAEVARAVLGSGIRRAARALDWLGRRLGQ